MQLGDDTAATQLIGGTTHHLTSFNVALNGKTYTGQQNGNQFIVSFNINDFQQGLSTQSVKQTETDTAGNTAETTGNMKMYNQPYSFASGKYLTQERAFGTNSNTNIDHQAVRYGGIATETLPENIAITYRGQAISKNETGSLEYTINYTTSNSGYGEGTITGMTGFGGGDITLERGNIAYGTHDATSVQSHLIRGTATFADGTSNNYRLGIYGPNATEIAGLVTTNQTWHNHYDNLDLQQEIGFAGSKQ